MRYTKDAEGMLQDAAAHARNLGHSYVGSEHLLLAMTQKGRWYSPIFWQCGLHWELAKGAVMVINGYGTRNAVLHQGFSADLVRILWQACREAGRNGVRQINSLHLIIALVRCGSGGAKCVFALTGVDENEVFTKAVEQLLQRTDGAINNQKEAMETKLLDQFSEDLLAKAVTMDPVIGRDREIEMVIGILCRKHKNNPALVGEPGVGKTAIAEGLAQRMASGNVPPQLRDKRLVSLNMANLVAGTKYRGEFEERLRDLLSEIKRCGDIVLFVDEMHTIVGAGAAEGAIDAANIFKPALGRGELQMLGATTITEYRKFIEKDSALDRRFRPVMVEAPSETETEAILNGLKAGLERHHHIRIHPEAIKEAIRLSIRYLTEQQLPDKAIDLLDEGAAHARMEDMYQGKGGLRQDLEAELSEAVRQSKFERAAELRDKMQRLMVHSGQKTGRVVTGEDIAWAVSARTGIPVGRLTTGERQRLLSMEKVLSENVIGQPEAVKAVAEAIRRGFSGIREPERPVSCLLFTGPTGVGKTELCRVLAQELFGTKKALIRLDMTEFMEKQSVARLIGAPAGYVGYEDGGKLTEAVRRRPYCLVLLDELEKAHPDVAGILLQIMEEGVLTDSAGRSVSFKNAVVVMTANCGGEIRSDGLGFNPAGKEEKALDVLRSHFAPEFLGRLDQIICFHPLDKSSLSAIAEKFLRQLRERLAGKGIILQLSPEITSHLVQMCDTKEGARQLRRLVQGQVETPLAKYLLLWESHRQICGELQNGEICFFGKS